jgi:geranylgeranyl reductase family protein
VTDADVLVVGAGPAGAATAAVLAANGHGVTLIDRARSPIGKPCGELITPRAITALEASGIGAQRLGDFHAVTHVRLTTATSSASTRWPSHDDFPDHGLVASRERLDGLLTDHAVAAGATLLRGHEATAPIVDRGFVRGAHVTGPNGEPIELRATFTVVADGANSRFGRALGTYRQPTWPSALAHRAIYPSALHDAAEIEFVLDLTDRAGTPITGFGWMFPRGDGMVNVGVLMMSTSPSFRVVNPAHLLDRFVAEHAKRWHLAGEPMHPPAGGRIPLGGSVGPAAGPTSLVVGDAVGAANPMSGAGVEYALETGLMAGGVLDEALRSGNAAPLQRYPRQLADRYASYHKVGRLIDRLLGRPSVARRVAKAGSSRSSMANVFVRIASNELRPHHPGTAEFTYRIAKALTIVAPDS